MLPDAVPSKNSIQMRFLSQLNSYRAKITSFLRVKMAKWLGRWASDFKVLGSNLVHFLKNDRAKRIYELLRKRFVVVANFR